MTASTDSEIGKQTVQKEVNKRTEKVGKQTVQKSKLAVKKSKQTVQKMVNIRTK